MNDKADIKGTSTDIKATPYDGVLRRAIARREARMPKLPPYLDGKTMERASARTQHARRLQRIMYGAAAGFALALALCAAEWLTPPAADNGGPSHIAASAHRQNANNGELKSPASAEPRPDTNSRERPHTYRQQATRTQQKAQEQTARESLVASYQKHTSEYIARLVQTYHAEAIPIDCRTDGSNNVYVFDDNEDSGVFQKLCMIAMWIDTDRPGVRMSVNQSQMTLQLDGSARPGGTDQLWLADRMNGRIYLYSSQSATDTWNQSACYAAFVGQNERKTEN